MFQHRRTKIFAAALISIGIGAMVLTTLGSNPMPTGAFSLSEYYHLAPIEKVISSNVSRINLYWDCIEVSYIGTKDGNIRDLIALDGMGNPEDIDCHFVIYNGLGGGDGQIQPTEKWQRQWSIAHPRNSYGSDQTIRIRVIADNQNAYPTDSQIKRTEALVETFSRKFDISPVSIYYPKNWR